MGNQNDTDSNLQASTPKLLVLSASDEGGLKRLAAEYTRFFSSMSPSPYSFDSYLESLAYTLNSRRSLLPWKSYLTAESMADLTQLGAKISHGQRSVSKPRVGFVFTGQGAQWAGMGRQLGSFDVFEQRLREAEEFLIGLGCRWHLRGTQLLRSKQGSSDQTRGASKKGEPVQHKQTGIQSANFNCDTSRFS